MMQTKEATAAPEMSLVDALLRTENNLRRLGNARPDNWANHKAAPIYNLLVIGVGSAGLLAAIVAAGLGTKVALVENHMMGRDCLNVGFVPSKAIIRSAKTMSEVHLTKRWSAYAVCKPTSAMSIRFDVTTKKWSMSFWAKAALSGRTLSSLQDMIKHGKSMFEKS